MHDVLIIGSGPAGISAAIYTSRAGLKTAVVSNEDSALNKSWQVENYYGFASPVAGSKLLDDGVLQAKRLGAEVFTDQVVALSYDNDFIIRSKDNEYRARSVVIATGSNRIAPKIKGFLGFEGKGISFCAICDAFFYRGKDVAVIGCCEFALHEALELLPVVKSVTLLTNTEEPIADFPKQMKIIQTRITEFEGKDSLERILFSDGTGINVAGAFIAIGVAGSTDLARMLGAQTEGLRIAVDENMATNVPGLYAAGDCTGGLMQIAKAVYEGAKAGLEAIKHVRSKK